MLKEMRGIRFLFTAILMCGLGFLIFAGTVIKMFSDTNVMRNGLQTIGQVSDTSRYVETTSDGKQYQRYRIHYTFQDANGSTFSNENTVSIEAYKAYTIGQSIEVYYYPNNPSESFVDMDGKVAVNQLQIVVGAALGLGGLIMLLIMDYASKKD